MILIIVRLNWDSQKYNISGFTKSFIYISTSKCFSLKKLNEYAVFLSWCIFWKNLKLFNIEVGHCDGYFLLDAKFCFILFYFSFSCLLNLGIILRCKLPCSRKFCGHFDYSNKGLIVYRQFRPNMKFLLFLVLCSP